MRDTNTLLQLHPGALAIWHLIIQLSWIWYCTKYNLWTGKKKLRTLFRKPLLNIRRNSQIDILRMDNPLSELIPTPNVNLRVTYILAVFICGVYLQLMFSLQHTSSVFPSMEHKEPSELQKLQAIQTNQDHQHFILYIIDWIKFFVKCDSVDSWEQRYSTDLRYSCIFCERNNTKHHQSGAKNVHQKQYSEHQNRS